MKLFRLLFSSVVFAGSLSAAPSGNSIESFDTLYNSLTVEKRGTVVELRARSRGSEYIESAVDLADPLKLVVAYTRTLYGGLFFQPNPQRVLMIGLGGAGFHRLFSHAFPDTLLQSVELDPKVYELCQTHLDFEPTANTPVALMDGRLFVKRDKTKWDWLILDAFRGGFVPPHLKTEEFYRECAASLSERGVFITNLHPNTQLYPSDLKTLRKVFPQVVLLQTPIRANVIAFAVNYRSPSISDESNWAPAEELTRKLGERVDLVKVKHERIPFPAEDRKATVLTDDFAPVEFLDAMKTNNTGGTR
ncbi:MAG TPA: fused MFS/spermidine synthase [Opitutus sp.]|nr:fused MFS/spermidine synthase [Opitutus sp.]